MKRSIVSLAFFLLVAATRGAALAGTTGAVSGHVFDQNGFPIIGATVQIAPLRDPNELNREVDLHRDVIDTRSTNAHGFFVFLSLDPGLYVIRPVLPGWNFYCMPRMVVFADQTSFIDLYMTDLELSVHCANPGYYGPP
jgi:hypothetical protein